MFQLTTKEGILRDLWTCILRPLWREKKPQAQRSSFVDEHRRRQQGSTWCWISSVWTGD
jgi:hypothetical protein